MANKNLLTAKPFYFDKLKFILGNKNKLLLNFAKLM